MAIKEHKIFVALSESLYWKQAYFKVLDGTFIKRAMCCQCCLMSDLMLKWFKIDPDPSLGGAIALSIKVPSKKRENNHASTIRPQRGQQKFCVP